MNKQVFTFNKLLKYFFLLFVHLIVQNTKAQDLEWAKAIGGSSFETITSVSQDVLGNTFVAGFFTSPSIDVDPGVSVVNIVNSGNNDSFIAKYDGNGNYIWSVHLGGVNSDICRNIGLDGLGNVYISGQFSSVLDFDPGIGLSSLTPTNGDVFMAKYDTNGNYIWAKKIGGTNTEDATKMLVDSLGNILLAGTFSGTVDFDPNLGVTTLSPSANASFIAKYDSSGNYVLASALEGTGTGIIQGLIVDSSENIYISSTFSGTFDFDPSPSFYGITSNGIYDICIAKYSSVGNFIWAKSFGGLNSESARSLVLDDFGNLYYAGNFSGSLDIDPSSVVNIVNLPSGSVSGIVQFDTLGSFKWIKIFKGLSDPSICLDNANHLYLVGKFSFTTLDVDPNYGIENIASQNGASTLIAKYDTLGRYIWGVAVPGGGSNQYCYVDDSTNIFVTGAFFGGDFDPNSGVFNLTSLGQSDCFIAKYSQGACSSDVLDIVDYSDFNCTDTIGFAIAALTGGNFPYNYQWNSAPVVNVSTIYTSNPGLYTVTTTDASGCINSRNILINGPSAISYFDLNVSLFTGFFRPAQTTAISLDGWNDGCVSTGGSLALVLDTALTFVSAMPPPSLISGDTILWNFTTLAYDSLHITPTVNVITDLSVSISDSIALNAIILPQIGDSDTTNNNKKYLFPVVNSYDPNVKSVYPQGVSSQGFIADSLTMTYTVQFQNTGTAEAIDIFILDTLDSDLDVSSLRVIASSHLVEAFILDGNVLEFVFDEIHLPDSTSNEPLSHGHVIYEIQQNIGLLPGTQIKNTANIYFDYNPPIRTNTVLNTIKYPDVVTNTNGVKRDKTFFYPNPMTDHITIDFYDIIFQGQITIFDIQGRLVYTQKCRDIKSLEVNTGNWSSGMYFIKIEDQNGLDQFYKCVKN
ncbi:MAG: T9SS type A sorting domain-containing protein [Bacteroidetes bacterium]|nr:T9SS type A sorting domain-containing protein [Bacteroidota bacterium]